MENTIRTVIRKRYNVEIGKITFMGGGFYARAFLVELPCEPRKIVLKLYLMPGLSLNEYRQIEVLSKSARLKMPKLYWTETTQENVKYEVLAMEYLSGSNAGAIVADNLTEQCRKDIAEEVVDNLLAYHHTINPAGFGAIGAETFVDDWRSYYRPIVNSIYEKAKLMLEQGKMYPEALRIMESAIEHYDDIFYLPITEARLIHGDYNMWNIMVDESVEHACAAIDPYNCCYADSEFDLYQLDNANGKSFGLLDLYINKQPVSENFRLKRAFYELFTEINHYYDSNVDMREYNLIPGQAQALYDAMREWKIV